MRARAGGVWTIAIACLAACACGRRADVTIAVAVLPSELPAYRAVVADWERASGRRVAVVPESYADVRRALAAEAAAGRGTLDLVELDVYALAAAAPHVRVLDEAALGDALAALEPAALAGGRIDGLRFLPHRVAWQALLYDREAVPRPPETWDELVEVARAHPGRIGFKGALYEGLTCDVLPFVWSAGGGGDVLDDAGAQAAFALFARLAPYVNPESATYKEATILDAMARGEVVLQLDWPVAMAIYASQGLAPGRIAAAPLPRGPSGRATVLGGGYVAIPLHAPHPDAALALLRHLLSHDVQSRLAHELGWFSARRDVPPGEGNPLLAGFAAMRAEARPRPARADYPRISRAWQEAFRAVVFDGAEPAATLERAAARLAGH